MSPESISIGWVTGPGSLASRSKRELQLPRIDALGLLAEEPLTEHVELMAQYDVLAFERW